MIAIEIIHGKQDASFGPRLAAFLNEHPEAEVLKILMKGIEGGKGLVAIVKYDIKEAPKPKPEPKIDREAIEKEAKKAELEAKLKALV